MPDDSHSATDPGHGGEPQAGDSPGGQGGATHAGTGADAHANPSLLKPEVGVAAWTFTVFIVLLFILKRFAWGPMLKTLDEREAAIRESLAEAEKARNAAASSIEAQERLLAEARREAQDLLAKSREAADRSREEIVAKARTESEKIIETGRRAIEQEKLAAIHEVRNAAIDLVMTGTAKLLRSQVDDEKGRALVREHIKQLEQSSN